MANFSEFHKSTLVIIILREFFIPIIFTPQKFINIKSYLKKFCLKITDKIFQLQTFTVRNKLSE